MVANSASPADRAAFSRAIAGIRTDHARPRRLAHEEEHHHERLLNAI